MADAEKLPEHKIPQEKIPPEIWILVVAAFTIALGYGLIAPLLPQFVVSFDVSMAAAGAVVAVFSASRLLFAPMSGSLVDKLGSRKVYLTGLITVAITTGLVAGAQHYWHILALRALAGIGSTMFTVSAMGLIVRLAPASIRGKCSATYATAFLLGNVIGPVLGASLSFLGFRLPFLIYGVGVGLAAVFVWWRMPADDLVELKAHAKPVMSLGEAWRDTAYRAVLTSGFAQGWINFGVRISVLPLFAAAIFADGAEASGYALATFAAGNAIVLQFSGNLADRIGRRPLIIAGLLGSGLFMGVLGLAESIPTLLLASALAGAASGLINPAQQAVIADIIGNDRAGGKVVSTFQMSMDLGQIFGPILIGALADMYGFTTAFALCGAVALVGIIAWVFGRETLQTRKTVLRPLRKRL